jgi:hypothetical protein
LVEVEFRGIISMVTVGNMNRAILVNAHDHAPTLTMPSLYKAQLEAIFPGKVTVHPSLPECSVPINGTTLRVVGTNGIPPNGYQALNFDPIVPGLQGKGVTTLHKDVTDPFPSGVAVTAWFEMRGETVPTPFKCKGRFEDTPDVEESYQYFNKYVTASMFTSTRARLQIRTSAAGGWQTIPLNATRVQIRVTNNHKDPNQWMTPHFDEFGKLNDPPVPVPNVIPHDACTAEAGTIPGCSNSAWP